MNTIQVKVFLLKNNLNLSQIARDLCTKEKSEQAIRVMLSQMLHGHRYYPTLARRFEERYGISLPRPEKTKRSAA